MHRADMDTKQNTITKEKVKPAKKFYGEMIKGNSWWLMKWMNTERKISTRIKKRKKYVKKRRNIQIFPEDYLLRVAEQTKET